MEPIAVVEIALRTIPLALKAWPWLQNRLTRNYSLYRLLAAVKLDGKGKDFNALYNTALDKLEGNTHPLIFELFRKNKDVKGALEHEINGHTTEVDTLYTLRMQLDADSRYDLVKDTIEQELQAMRIFIFSAILDSMTHAERLQHGLLQDIHANTETLVGAVAEIKEMVSQQQSIRLAEETKLRQEEFDEDISAIIKLIDDKHLLAAILQLQDFSARKWEKLAPHQKYKVTANLGLCHFELGERDKAAGCFIQLPAFNETSVTYGLAALGFALNQECTKAEVYAEKSLAIDPDDENAWAARLECAPDDMPYEELEAWLDPKRLESHPMLAVSFAGMIKAHYPAHYSKGIELMEKVLPQLPENTVAWAESIEFHGIMLASTVFEADKNGIAQDEGKVEAELKKAIACLSAAWDFYRKGDLHTSKWSVLANRGTAYRRLGEREHAQKDFINSIHEQPHYFTYQQLVQLKMEMGEDCLPVFDEMEVALQLDPQQKEQLYVARIYYLFQQQQYDRVIEALDTVWPEELSPEAMSWLHNIHIKSMLAVDRNQDALGVAKELLVAYPDNIDYNYLAAHASYQLNDMSSAKKYILGAAAVDGKKLSPEFLNELTALLYELELFDETIALLQQADVKDELSILSQRLMSSLALTDRPEEAAEIAKPLLNMEQPEPLVAQLIIESYERQGKNEDVLDMADAMKPFFPKEPVFYLKALIAALRLNDLDIVKKLLAEMPDEYSRPTNTLEILGEAIVLSEFDLEKGVRIGKEYTNERQDIQDIDRQYQQFLALLGKV